MPPARRTGMQSRDWLAYIFSLLFLFIFPSYLAQACRVPRKSQTYAEIELGVTYDLYFNPSESSRPASARIYSFIRQYKIIRGMVFSRYEDITIVRILRKFQASIEAPRLTFLLKEKVRSEFKTEVEYLLCCSIFLATNRTVNCWFN